MVRDETEYRPCGTKGGKVQGGESEWDGPWQGLNLGDLGTFPPPGEVSCGVRALRRQTGTN